MAMSFIAVVLPEQVKYKKYNFHYFVVIVFAITTTSLVCQTSCWHPHIMFCN